MEPLLTFPEARVLGCLLEKAMATPDYYPMTVNSLIAACNQSSNRHPVVSYGESEVEEALSGLRRKKLAAMLHLAGSRAPKYKHLAEEYFPGLRAAEHATLAVLLLRGPQTAAEIRTRTERLHAFADQEETDASLRRLQEYQTGPLVVCLPPGQGRRVAAYAHLLCGEAMADAPAALPMTATAPATLVPAADWRTVLEAEVAALRARIEALETALGVTPPPQG